VKTTTIRRAALSIAGLALAATSLTACGSDDEADTAGSDTSASASAEASTDASDDASDDASADPSDEADTEGESDASDSDFCGVYSNLFQELTTSLGNGGDVASIIPQLKDYAEQLEEVGAPDDIPEDAERGFEVSLQAISDLPDDATQEDLLASSEGYSAEDQADATAFGQYVVTACPDLVPSAPTAPSPAG
jgi:predicted small secreted protein